MKEAIKKIVPTSLWKMISKAYHVQFVIKNKNRVNRSKKAIAKYKDCHKGERCFIIGNGPSLKAEDLTKLKKEYTFGMNTIFKIFPETPWRPTFYFVQDTKIIENFGKDIVSYGFDEVFVPLVKDYNYRNLLKNLSQAKCFIMPDAEKYPAENKFIYDLSKGVIGNGLTITYACMQMAVYMGFSEIYLIGMDHSFSVNMRPDGTIEYDKSVKSNHFGKDYAEGKMGTTFFLPKLQETELAYTTAKRFAEYHGLKIYNATRGGKLEVFERVNLDDIVK